MSINLADSSLWEASLQGSNTAGKAVSGGDFAVNGDGNFREIRTDPWGNPALVWVSKNNDVTNDADGGWNKNIGGIDASKKYLSVVYFRRVSDSAAGRSYHGCMPGVENLGTGVVNGNPYFCYPLLSEISRGDWYVSVGIIHDSGFSGGYSGVSGIYKLSTGAKSLTSTEYRLAATATTQMHRAYLYYSTNPLDEVEWWNPIFCAIDGTEPSLADLLSPPMPTSAAIIPQSFDEWLYDTRNHNYRVTLVEIHGVAVYDLATQPYFQPARAWDDLILDDILLESAIDASISAGDFTFADGYRTHWGAENFYGKPCRIWLGDIRWNRADFRQLADLVIDHIQRVSDGIWRVTFTDAMPALEANIKGATVAGKIMPIVFGSPKNISPVLTDYPTLTYRFNESAVTAISAVRDRGLSQAIAPTLSLATGEAKLRVSVAGQITGDVTASPTYLRDVVAALLTRAGIPTTAASISMRRFPTAYPNGYPVNLLITGEPTYRDTLAQVCTACGASLSRTATSGYSLTYITLTGTPAVTLTADDLLDIAESSRERIYKDVVVNYNKNWTVQTESDLAGGVPLSDVKKYGSEFFGKLTATTTYSGSLHDGTMTVDILSGLDEAKAEAERLSARYAVFRRSWEMKTVQTGMIAEVGDIVRVEDSAAVGNLLVEHVTKNFTDLTVSIAGVI